MNELECLNGPDGCSGAVELRWPGYGEKMWPRCKKHGDERLAREEEGMAKYGHPDSALAPAGFDPMDAGERWDEDDY